MSQNETKLLKQITNPKEFEKNCFSKKNKDLDTNFYIPSGNDFIKKYCGQIHVDNHQRSHNQSERAEDGKNGFLKTFLI